MPINLDPSIRDLIRLALSEDLGSQGDLSTRCFIPASARLRAVIIAKKPGILCGLPIAREVLRQAAPGARFHALVKEGAKIRPGQAVARLEGPREILTAERTALNFLQRMSGIATLTRAYADRLRGTQARLYDTRKTLPGWRKLDKYAVRCGGGFNHRMGLYDMVMLKDNHMALYGKGKAERREASLQAAVRKFKRSHPSVPVLVEAKTRSEIRMALDAKADIILLDNMSRPGLRHAIRHIRGISPRTRIEVSGGVDLDGIRAIARLGADRISVGRLTHSATALDMSLELLP